MSERYIPFFHLPSDQHIEGCPILIRSGTLLKDTVTGKILAQLRFKNVSDHCIKSVRVTLIPQDAAGHTLNIQLSHQYSNLNVGCGEEFGQTQAILFPDPSVSAYSIIINEVQSEDGILYSNSDAQAHPLPQNPPTAAPQQNHQPEGPAGEKGNKIGKKILIISGIVSVLVIFGVLFVNFWLVPYLDFKEAVGMVENGDYSDARKAFNRLGSFGKSEEHLSLLDGIQLIEDNEFEAGIQTALTSGIPVTINYETQGGSVPQSQVTYHTPEDFSGLASAEKEGYRFVRWKLSSVDYDSKDALFVDLRAVWSNKFQIQYELNGGTADNPESYQNNGSTVPLANPTKVGYTFLGWTGSHLETPTKDYTIPANTYGDLLFTANWEANTYRITFNCSGGSLSQTSLDVVYDSNFTLPTPTRNGYTFVGWYTGSVEFVPGTWALTNDLTLTAKWEEIRYQITYHLDDGTNATLNPNSYTAGNYSITLKDATKRGYTFLGWYSDPSFINRVTTINTALCEDIELYAKWKIETYTIEYVSNGGTISGTPKTTFTVNDLPFSLPSISKEGCTFLGWYNGFIKYTEWDNTTSITLTAKWEPIKFKITYNLNGGSNASQNPATYSVESGIITLQAPTRNGYTFQGWYSDSSFKTKVTQIDGKAMQDVVLYAKWELATYTVSYSANGGTISGNPKTSFTINDLPMSLPSISRTGYSFLGWYSGSTKYTNLNTAANVTLTAKWEPIKFKITYNLNGGSNASQNPATYTIESGIITLQAPTRNGYTFQGWYSDSSFKNKVTQIDSKTMQDVTLYAKWEIITYSITYHLNGGTLSGNSKTSFTVNDLPLTLPTATKNSFAFIGWNRDSTSGKFMETITTCENFTLYASFMDPNLKLTLSSDKKFYIVSSYSGTATHVEIPAYFKGLPVTQLGNGSRVFPTSIVSVTLPNTITVIQSSAFNGCKKLSSITIPNGVTKIGSSAFYDCESLTSIYIPDSVTSIGSSAFDWCEGLTTVRMPSKLTFLGDDAFSFCRSLTSIVIPEGITELGFGVLYDCTSLKSVTLPSTLTTLDGYVFKNCRSLTSIIIPKSVTSISDSTFIGCSSITFYCRASIIPDDWDTGWNNNRPVVWGYTGN